MSKIVDGLLYSESHEWVKVDGNVAIVGISDHAQSELGDITYVDMPDVDDEVRAGEDFGAVESVKTSSEIIAPVSGKIVACNAELEEVLVGCYKGLVEAKTCDFLRQYLACSRAEV